MPRDAFIRLCVAKLGDETRPVVIKAMRDERACQREVDARATRDLSSEFVMGIRDHYGGETFLEAAAQADDHRERFGEYCACIVMDAADRNLEQIYQSERLSFASARAIRARNARSS